MGRFTRSLLLFGLASIAAFSSAQVITMSQTPVMNSALMGVPGYWYTQDAVVNSWQPDGDAQRIDLSITRTSGRFGQNLASSPTNWTNSNFLTMVIQNTQTYGMRLAFMVSTLNDPNDFTDGYYAEIDVPPMASTRYAFYFDEPPVPNAQMKILPKPFDGQFTRINCILNTNLSSIKHWRLVNKSASGGRLIISGIRNVTYSLTLTDVVDDFFQYTARGWQGKVTSIADMQIDAAQEQTDLLANPTSGELLGTTSMPNQGTNARWRTARINNKWFFVHPNGRPFWSMGLNGIHDNTYTKISGRDAMFTTVPSHSGPNADLYVTPSATIGEVYRVVAHNMRLKYPGVVNTRPKFLELANQRLASWGINTLSAGAAPELYDNSRPYVILLKTLDFSPHIPTPTTAWSTPPDPFAANFQSWMTTQFTQQLAAHNGRSNFMGVFVDNEMSWGHTLPGSTLIDRYSVALGVLAAPANQPSKMEFVRTLTRKYRTITRLNAAWRTTYPAFSSLNGPIVISNANTINAAMGQDFQDFTYRFACAYFTKVKAALNAAGCTGLYMGCRFWHQVPEVLTACSNSVDVMSFNDYNMPSNYNWALLNSMRKPVLISEWSVNIDEGPTLGYIGGITRAQRGQLMRDMYQRALTEPNIIGLHMYEMYDMPITNRGSDTENYGLGILDVTDAPHQEAVDALRWAANNIYVIRH